MKKVIEFLAVRVIGLFTWMLLATVFLYGASVFGVSHLIPLTVLQLSFFLIIANAILILSNTQGLLSTLMINKTINSSDSKLISKFGNWLVLVIRVITSFLLWLLFYGTSLFV